MNIKNVKIRKGMTKDEVNNLISKWITLEDPVYMGNNIPHNWKCKCGEIIEGRIWVNIRRRGSTQCRRCRLKKITDKHIIFVSNTGGYEYIKSYLKGDTLMNGKIAKSPSIRVKHLYCGSEYDINVSLFNNKKGCSKCCQKYENSFAYHIEVELGEPLDKYWDFEKNTVNPYHIYKNSAKKVWIKCTSGKHIHTYNVYTYSFVKGHRCNKCVNKNEDMITSFAQYHIDNTDKGFLEKYWDWDKNTLNPWEISPKGSKDIWVKCQNEEINKLNRLMKKDYHGAYKTNTTAFTNGSRCPYCNTFASKKVHKLDSFGYHNFDKVMSWHPDNDISPFRVARNSERKYKFVCHECNYTWNAMLSNISKGKWCPKCASSKGEKRIKVWLDMNNIKYINDQPYFKDLLSDKGNQLRPDFILPDYRIWIEYDGEFHYRKMYDEDEYKTLKIHDKRKDEYAKKHGWKLIRIPYWEFDNIENILEKGLKTMECNI